MKIQLLSDLHIEFEYYAYPKTDADAVVLAGDIHTQDRGVKWALQEIKDKPVIYVLGNHDFYGESYPNLVEALKAITKNTNVHILENDLVTINGVNFLGCTLWTDFEIFGDASVSEVQCQQLMMDYRKIELASDSSMLRSVDTSAIHSRSVKWLKQTLEERKGEINVVVTHHGPSIRSVPEMYLNDVTTAAYVSNLEDLIRRYKPNYWLHGHLHTSCDYMIDDCWVISNPKGYPESVNLDYLPDFCMDVTGS